MKIRKLSCIYILAVIALAAAGARSAGQPKVQPGPGEPNWEDILKTRYGLSMRGDLANRVETTVENVPGLFQKAGDGPVKFTPLIALGLETTTRGGWYAPGAKTDAPHKHNLWSYKYKNTAADLEHEKNLPPPLLEGSTTMFDPGREPFGLWISNDGFDDGGVFTQPSVVAAINKRLAKQPYKAMIYPVKDKATDMIIPNAYLIGWEYSTNDDFQDVVCRIDNVVLTPKKR